MGFAGKVVRKLSELVVEAEEILLLRLARGRPVLCNGIIGKHVTCTN